MDQPRALKANTRVGTYAIVEVVDTNSHSVIYLAREEGTSQDFWLQEFIPREFAHRRLESAAVEALPGQERGFDEALTLFLKEARILSQIHDPFVIRVREYAEAAGTAFMSMDLESGSTLKARVERSGPLPQEELRNLFVPLLTGLRVVHSHGLLHRDINPANLFIRDDGSPLLTGFGSTHRTLPIGRAGLEHRVTPGFSAAELYEDQGRLGPWTDLYGVGAMMYLCISGKSPAAADVRVSALTAGEPDPVPPAVEAGCGRYDSRTLNAVDVLLKTRIEDRPQSVDDILSELIEMPDHESGDAEAQTRPSPQPAEQKELTLDAPRIYTGPGGRVPPRRVPRGSNPWFWIISTGMLAGVGAFTFWPQIEPLLSPPEQESARAPDHIEGTTIPKDILQRPLPADEPPEVPESVNFTRKADDFRMEQYRQLDQRDKEISALLRSARAKIERGELVDPVDENALAVYRAVLLLDEDNVDALQGIDEIGSRLIERATASLDRGELEDAVAVLDDLDVSDIEDPRIEEMRQRVDDLLREETAARDAHPEATLPEEAQGETRMQPGQPGLADQSVAEQRLAEAEPQAPELESIRRQDETPQDRSGEPQQQEAAITEHRTAPGAEDTVRINSLLLQARIASGGGALNRASAADALPYYQEVLSLDPGNEEASAGVSGVYRFYVDQANESLATDRFEDVSKNLDLAAAILPDSETVALLRQQLALRQSALAEAERKKRAESKSAATRKAPKAKPPIDKKQLANGIAAYYGGRYEEAYARLKPLAEKGSARAQFRLGVMYLRGRGVGQNLGAGTQWIEKAFPRIKDSAVAGEAWAQADLGSLYQTGLLVAKNDAEAVRWYRAAAEQGYAGAQTNLGAMYADGKGVAQDRDEAVKWLRRAAEQGDKIARENLSALGVQNLN